MYDPERIARSIHDEDVNAARERAVLAAEAECPVHRTIMNLVCGERVCGLCYADALPALPTAPRFAPLPDMSMVGGHVIPALKGIAR
jgi:hypothetical protein